MSFIRIAWPTKKIFLLVTFALIVIVCDRTFGAARTLMQPVQQLEDEKGRAAVYGQQLSSPDSLLRQRAAEQIARDAAAGQRKLIEGHRLQERNARVRLALDWALYRLGKNEALFRIVQQLGDGSRADQARGYLTQIEGPAPLYMFLDRSNDKVKLKLMEVFAEIGDADTAERLRYFTAAKNEKIAGASQRAISQISDRLSRASTDSVTRPRRLGSDEKP
ncbi:MAG: hypothetical protein WKF30_17085 [Pyrinomonadaceae bacterium]